MLYIPESSVILQYHNDIIAICRLKNFRQKKALFARLRYSWRGERRGREHGQGYNGTIWWVKTKNTRWTSRSAAFASTERCYWLEIFQLLTLDLAVAVRYQLTNAVQLVSPSPRHVGMRILGPGWPWRLPPNHTTDGLHGLLALIARRLLVLFGGGSPDIVKTDHGRMLLVQWLFGWRIQGCWNVARRQNLMETT